MRHIKKFGALSLLGLLPFIGHADEGEAVYTKGGEKPQALACTTCHGAQGLGLPAAGYPNVTGMSADYLAKQLHDFRDGTRSHPIMDPIARALSDDEIDSVTEYMESFDVKEVPMITRAATPTDEGSWLALRGDWSRNVPECVACHGPSGVGVGESFPRLADQSSVYIVNQLKAWQNGTRHNDQDDLMGHIARALTEDEMKAVAEYFATISDQQEEK
ncbi:cytochrome c [Wohlfahrtiimonas sp. G9077]|uniref:c-type cytochrome n=1 Tax=Wohlfahrtiimonas sp. G9077 TaxID=1980118 RepID=UPI000B9966AB|nr:c-type cytochrome [Wohlfahrtiimonas sp. G9077]OYQ73715.1 cytochrome c4 [Wohlfahrtiimonas sp. G9077]